MHSTRSRNTYVVVGALWAAAILIGLARLLAYESTSDISHNAPPTWPMGSVVHRVAGMPTLVVLAHPRCPCSRATIGELAKLMTACQGKVSATVLIVRPSEFAEGWERTDLWESAAAIPGVTVTSDIAGVESSRFGAATSGQTLLYSADGKLLFAGGITESRGHWGDNAGRSVITSLVLGSTETPTVRATPVYGCPLFDPLTPKRTEGVVCHAN